ncbi:hypothetical protein PMG71_19440 [Roseofilum sp. BLCC_M154]|uniref:Uncharacterized protein n=1 Tax=Roseofilum acuticapitatum BLCC-M154 TaxID=3022444 RepID=A0ABT7AXG8_9CYAN|nr:hypothetical protein [Roseofilum acuticapitatum]MDJ1171609.1 hypothetical protein [Roseofilum acuticapitatum BLCC-M154]
MDTQRNRIRQQQQALRQQRQALEDAYTNFVEPQVNQQIEIPVHPLPTPPVNSSVCYSVCGWLLLTLVYCLCIGCRKNDN